MGLPLVLIPMVLVLMNFVYAVAAYPSGVLSDRCNRLTMLIIGFGLLIAADVALAFAPGLTGIAVCVTLWGLHMGVTQGPLATLVADTAPPGLPGTAYGMFNLMGGLALMAASILAGALWEGFGPKATLLAGACFTAIAFAGLGPVRWRLPKLGASHKASLMNACQERVALIVGIEKLAHGDDAHHPALHQFSRCPDGSEI